MAQQVHMGMYMTNIQTPTDPMRFQAVTGSDNVRHEHRSLTTTPLAHAPMDEIIARERTPHSNY